MEGFPSLLQNSKWKVRAGNISLWFDKFMDQGPLCERADLVENPSLQVRDMVVNDRWDVERLEFPVGAQRANEIMMQVGRL